MPFGSELKIKIKSTKVILEPLQLESISILIYNKETYHGHQKVTYNPLHISKQFDKLLRGRFISSIYVVEVASEYKFKECLHEYIKQFVNRCILLYMFVSHTKSTSDFVHNEIAKTNETFNIQIEKNETY